MPKIVIPWKPQPRQLKFLEACGLAHPFTGGKPQPAKAKAVGYGGAAGGGKSDALCGMAVVAAMTYENCNIIYLRRTLVMLDGLGGPINRMREILAPLSAAKLCRYNETKHEWTFWNGSKIKFSYYDKKKDEENHQGLQYDVVLIDEATHFELEKVRWMFTRNRSTCKIPRPFVAMATNPGSIGHAWFKEQFVDAGDPEVVHEVQVENKLEQHMFIPAKLSDNKILEERDPEYRSNLEAQPEIIRRQLLDGDWDIIDGVAFSEWRRNFHVCKPFEIPEEWTRFRSCDWGYAKPYHIGWFAIDFDGRLYMYRELYGWGGKPDVGSKEDPADVAKKILAAETYTDSNGIKRTEKIMYSVADDAIFGSRQDNSPTIGEQFARNGVYFQPVGKGKGSRISGKLEVHYRLKVPSTRDEQGFETPTGEEPMLVVFENCIHTIRTLPVLLTDPNNPEDVDTKMEDHAYDSVRYGCMSRPIASNRKPEAKTRIQTHKEKLAKRQFNNVKIV